MTQFLEQKNKSQQIFLILLAIIMLVIGVCLSPFTEIISGIKNIITHPSLIDFDSFTWSQSFGAPFFQSGLCLIIVILIFTLTKSDLGGGHIANAMMVAGFSFYGKNILNIWFPMIGTFIYALVFKKKLSSVTPLALALTCISPIFSTLAFYTPFFGSGSLLSYITAGVITIAVGFFACLFSDYFPKLHHGLLLYNAGMAAGWAAIILNSLLKTTGFGHDAYPYTESSYLTDHNLFFFAVLVGIFLFFIVLGLIFKGSKNTFPLFTYNSEGGCHIAKFGFGSVLINMGIVGILATAYAFVIGADLNGTTFTGIFASVGFTAFGSTPRTQFPVFLGVALGAFLTGGAMSVVTGDSTFIQGALAKIATRGMLLSTLFSCGASPVTGKHGAKAGFLVGFVHSFVVTIVAPLHGWMSLYNNGFGYGLVVTFLYPIYSRFSNRKQ